MGRPFVYQQKLFCFCFQLFFTCVFAFGLLTVKIVSSEDKRQNMY
jgi:hypothetical protein